MVYLSFRQIIIALICAFKSEYFVSLILAIKGCMENLLLLLAGVYRCMRLARVGYDKFRYRLS